MRALFFNEGNLDTHVLGHGQLDAAILAGQRGTSDVETHFAGLSALTGRAHTLSSKPIRLLRKADLDMVVLRWHLVQSQRARRELKAELDRWPADVVHLYTPAVALAMADVMRATPVVLSTGATIHDWWSMPAWRRIALVRDPDRRRQLGDAGRSRCEARFDARRQFALLAGHLRDAIALHRDNARRTPEPQPALDAAG